ncbi:hypothetical protein [Aliiglaciecola sp. LCG003]|uniref:hypothetical protein n=1 Tax=Aliiglaciecola sp. LCG003 TaxID=3053655 RepID=UPI0025724470|nr:hypothetical protein [Aliiglaciecola sp. LCG003]WJG10420.1 hypothetical protein QR722_05105 [Aliiglaciecola sp. LCG003]
MSQNLSYIVNLCRKIQSNGQKPSVALIKKSANRPLPLPEIIGVLRRWNDAPQQFADIKLDEVEHEAPSVPPDIQLTALSQRVDQLEKQLENLLQQVQVLNSKPAD